MLTRLILAHRDVEVRGHINYEVRSQAGVLVDGPVCGQIWSCLQWPVDVQTWRQVDVPIFRTLQQESP